MSETLKCFVISVNSEESDEVVVSELCLTYHTISHNLSYLSATTTLIVASNYQEISSIIQRYVVILIAQELKWRR